MGVLKVKSGGVWVPVGMSMQAGTPVGKVAQAISPSGLTLTTINTWTDIPGLSITWTADPSRTYLFTVRVVVQKLTAAGDVFLKFCDPSGTQLENAAATLGINAYGVLSIIYTVSGLSGTQTRKLMGFTNSNGVQYISTGGGQPLYATMLLEDITPATAPSGVTPWTGVTFQNGWANKGGAEQTCQYRKVGDMVQLRGSATKTAVGYGAAAFTLPVGFRPPATLRPNVMCLSGAGSQAMARADVLTDGSYLASQGPVDALFWCIDFAFSITV